MNANSRTALDKRNAMVKEARTLGIDKPNTMKNDVLEAAIASVKAERAAAKAERELEGDPFDEIDPSVEGDHLTDLGDQRAEREATREAWLLDAVDMLIPLMGQAGAANLAERRKALQVSVGLPKGNVRKVIGQCHYAAHNDGITHIFISPVKDDAIEVLGILVHELVHADDQGESGHSKHFRRVCEAIKLDGCDNGKGGKTFTATEVSADLRPVLEGIVAELGPYPHTKLNLGATKVKTQTTRMLKLQCPACECTVRTTKKWIETYGEFPCPCGNVMLAEGQEATIDEEPTEEDSE